MENNDLKLGTDYSGKKFPEAWEIYKRKIVSGSTALVVGPSISIGADPSLLQTTYRLGQAGRVFVCDPQEKFLEHFKDPDKLYDEARKPEGERTIGYGDVRGHLRQLQQLKALGMPLANAEWLGVSSSAIRMSLQDSHVDSIVDHGTSIFIATNGKADPWDSLPLLRRIYAEYRRVLKPRGNLLLQRNVSRYGLSNDDVVIKALKENGFLIDEEVKVKDVFQVEIEAKTFSKIRDHAVDHYDDDFGHGDKLLHMLFNNEPPVIRNVGSDHFSPDLLLATSNKTGLT